MSNLQSEINSLDRSVTSQSQEASQNLESWKKYEATMKTLTDWMQKAEPEAVTITSKPMTLDQARKTLEHAQTFEKQCNERIPHLQELSQITRQIVGKMSAPDETDSIHTRWNVVHDSVTQTITKLDKLATSWKAFEEDADRFDSWLKKSETLVTREFDVKTPETAKLEQDLARLKEFSKEISDHQAQLISLTQLSDQVSQGLSIEVGGKLKNRVTDMKTRVGQLANTVRQKINSVSEAFIARQEFQMRVSDFESWMSRLRSNIPNISDIHVGNVDTSLQTVHAYLQEHLDKQVNFAGIYDEVKSLSVQISPEEAGALNDMYASLAENYKSLEDDLREKKKGLEKWVELVSWHSEATAQLDHCKYESDARKPALDDLKRITLELEAVCIKIRHWKDQAPMIDQFSGVSIRDGQGRPLTATSLVNQLETTAKSLENELSSKKDRLVNLGVKWDNFRKLQHQLTEDIVRTQTHLQEVTYRVETCEKLGPAIEEIAKSIEEHQARESEKKVLHRQGNDLLKEDERAVTSVQAVLSSVDANWEKVKELLNEQRKKYENMNADWKQYKEAKEKLTKCIQDSDNLCQSLEGTPNDGIQANSYLEQFKKTLEVLKKGKQHLDKMDLKSQQITKESSLMPSFKITVLDSDLSDARKSYQDAWAKITEKCQACEAQAIIWKQIDEAKNDLIQWLSNTSEALSSARENPLDAENGQSRLAKYYEELPAYQLLRQNIIAKHEQLLKMNNGAPISTLTSLNELLNEQFQVVRAAAEQLESLTSTLNECERIIRQELKNSGDSLSRIRENVIKCDDLTGDNTKILERINKCKMLKNELENSNSVLSEIERKMVDMSAKYPFLSKSSLPKELQALQLRKSGILSHVDKVNATLVAFLTKLYHEKFGTLKRTVATHMEKIAWCEPEQSSDRYNLEVKMASLADVEAGITDCQARKSDTDKFLELLESVEDSETMAALKSEQSKVARDLESVKNSYIKIKDVLEHNIALWQQYEQTSEGVTSWLKEMENRARAESSALVNPFEIENKIRENDELSKIVSDYQSSITKLTSLGQKIVHVNPESRVGQDVEHLNSRYQAVVKFLSQHLVKLEELKEGRDRYNEFKTNLEHWLDDAEEKLKTFNEDSGPKAIAFYQTRLKELKTFNEQREKGQVILNHCIEAGEMLYARISPAHRDIIRSELRNLRNRVDALSDKTNVIFKKTESDMMHRSSFEDKFTQVNFLMCSNTFPTHVVMNFAGEAVGHRSSDQAGK